MKNWSILQKLFRNIVIIIITITALIIVQQKIYNDYISDSISQQYLSDIAFRVKISLKDFTNLL